MNAQEQPEPTRTVAFDQNGIAEAAALVVAGRPVAIPTETVYGLAARADDGAAVAGIYEAKGRPSFNPLIVHISSLAQAERIAVFDDRARALAQRFWPGPLTLVLPLQPDAPVASLASAGLPTIALRMPAHPAMRALIEATGLPLAAPSANASGAISPTRADHVVASLAGRIPLIVDAGPTTLGLESTIVRVDPDGLSLLRPGPVTAEMLGTGVRRPEDGRIVAPGQMESHYAPSKPVRLDAAAAREGEFLIGFGAIAGDANLSASGDLGEAAARLFDLLHRADAAPAAAIAVAPVPETGLGVAINDRLRRAAAPRTPS